jgi:hypothetical protein
MDLMADPEIERDPDGCVRIDGRDCFARNEPCPPPGWCPASTDAFDRYVAATHDEPAPVVPPGSGKTMAMAWALAWVLQQSDPSFEPPCPFEPRRRGTACP